MDYFLADTHGGHERVLDFCAKTRKFTDIKEHDKHIARAVELTLTDDDDLWILGDFSFHSTYAEMRDFYFSLRGRKHLIVGNHDGKMTLERLPWESIDNYKELYYKKTKVVLSHYPFNIGQWNAAHHGSIHLYGHVHGNPQYNEPVRALDVGIDSIGFAPISMEAVYKKMMNIPKFVPYHERNKGK